MKILKFPFLSLSVFFVAGILTYPFLAMSSFLWLVLVGSFLSLILIGGKIFISKYFRLIYWLLYALLFWSIGLWTMSLHDSKSHKQHYIHLRATDKKDFLTLIVAEKWNTTTYGTRYLAKVKICNAKQTFGKVLVVVPNHHQLESFKIGEVLIVYQRIVLVGATRNPHQFNYRLFLEQHDIYGQVYLDTDNFKSQGIEASLNSMVANWREILIESFDKHQFSPEVSAFVNALLFGQKQDLSPEIKANFRDLGIIHVLAISGLHIGIIYLVLQQLLRRLGFSTPYIYRIATVLLWLFALISGFAAPVVRAVFMFTIGAFIYAVRRSSTLYNSLAITLVVLLSCSPNYIYDVGFQLSFSAVFSIAFFYSIFASFATSKWWVLQYFKEIIAVSLAVQIGVLPLMIYYFHQIPLLFLVGNIIVIPLVTVILIGLILLLVLNFLWKSLALVWGTIVAFIINAMNSIVSMLSQWSDFNLKQLSFNVFLTVISTLWLLGVVYGLKRRRRGGMRLSLLVTLVFQLCFMFTVILDMQKEERFLLYHRDHITFLFKKPFHLEVYSNDTAVMKSSIISDYGHRNFIGVHRYLALNYLMSVGDKRLLIIDSLGNYKTTISADILLFSGRSKINYDRVLAHHNPSLVLINADFPFWESKRLVQVCLKKNIPFHSVSEKGYYKF